MPLSLALLARAGVIAFVCRLPWLACCFQSSTTLHWTESSRRHSGRGLLTIHHAGGGGPSASHGGSDPIGSSSSTVESTSATSSASSSTDTTATMEADDSSSSFHAATATTFEPSDSADLSSSSEYTDNEYRKAQVGHDEFYFARKEPLLHNSTTQEILERRPSVANDESNYDTAQQLEPGMSRRDVIRRTATIIVAGTFIGGGTVKHQWESLQASSKKIADLNYTRIIKESSIEIVVDGPMNREFLNAQTFQKVQTVKLPKWVPSFLVPPPKVIHDVTNVELLTAAAVAGSIVEMARTSLLYPLLTLKTRVQTDVNVNLRKRGGGARRPLDINERLQVTQELARKHFREGNLYAGLLPSLVISVPATGVYFGIRDVMVRKLIPYTDALGGSISVALLAALVADVISLIIRTPADLLAVRLQAATGEEFEWEESQDRVVTEAERKAYLQDKIGNWFLEAVERLPAVILTDLPFLLSRIALNRLLLQGGPVSLGRYEGIVLFSAILCGFLTTPFDVARTRILVDSDDDPTNGIDGGSGEGLFRTLRTIKNEGDGGYRNLFAGWLERVAYLGIGRAWIEPLQILGYLAIRDFILLEWF